jgi:hypothetical protein
MTKTKNIAEYELVELLEDGTEDSLLATGTMTEMEELAESARETAEDDGYDLPRLRIQPAA